MFTLPHGEDKMAILAASSVSHRCKTGCQAKLQYVPRRLLSATLSKTKKMMKFVNKSDSGKKHGDTSAGSQGADAAPISRLNSLLGQAPAKPADELDVESLSALSVSKKRGSHGDGESTARGAGWKRSRAGVASAGADAGASAGSSDAFDISLSPPDAAAGEGDGRLRATINTRVAAARGAKSAKGRGSGKPSDVIPSASRSNRSARSTTCAAAARGKSGVASDMRSDYGGCIGDAGGDYSGRSGAEGGHSSGSSSNRRSVISGGGSSHGAGDGAGGGGGGGVFGKMGPWARRPGERAICAEDDYDPLELMQDANREIFGNDAFRGVQEDVRAGRFWG